MPDVKSILLLCAFLCFITGIFSPEVIIRSGIPCVKTRKRILVLFGSLTLLLVLFNQIGESLPDAYKVSDTREEPSNIYVFSPIDEGEPMKVYKVAETGFTNQLDIKIIDQQTSSGNENYIVPEGYEFIQLTLEITNKMEESYTLNLNELQLQTGMFEVLTPALEEQAKRSLELEAAETVELSLMYLQPSDESLLTLTYLPFKQEVSDQEEPANEVKVSKIGEIVKTNQAMIQVHEVSRVTQSKKVGYEYIEVSLSIKNPSKSSITYYPFHFELGCSLNPTHVKSTLGLSEVETLAITELASGGMVTGTLLFEVPKGASDLKLYYHEPTLFNIQTTEINLMEMTTQTIPLQSELILNENWKTVETLDEMTLNILKTDLALETKYTKAKNHHQFVMVEVEITNDSTEEREYTAFDFKLMNEHGLLMMPSLLMIDNQTELKSGTLAPNESAKGYLVFEDSDLFTTFYLLYSPSHWKTGECMIQSLE